MRTRESFVQLMHETYVNYDKFKNKSGFTQYPLVWTFDNPQDFYLDAVHSGAPKLIFTDYVKRDFTRREIRRYSLSIMNKFNYKLTKHGTAKIEIFCSNALIGIVLSSTPNHEVNVWMAESGLHDAVPVSAKGPRGAIEIGPRV